MRSNALYSIPRGLARRAKRMLFGRLPLFDDFAVQDVTMPSAPDSDLARYFWNNEGKVIRKWHHYF
ncbi:MAG TPA: hypothetical protein VFJ13_10010, partial [Paracoccaceae bacterium]|nr:hypothetical protein [Paracoccaceae bacterium]